MKYAFPHHPGDEPPKLGFLLLVLLIVEALIALAIITGKVPPQDVGSWLITGTLFAAAVLLAGTLIIWKRPSYSQFRLEVIIDIPQTELEQIRESFLSEGARVVAEQQADGLYRVEAFFLSEA